MVVNRTYEDVMEQKNNKKFKTRLGEKDDEESKKAL